MDRKERALELARQQYADGGGPRYTPSYTEHGALIEPSMRDRANMVRDAFDSVAGHPFVRVAREYPREMAQEIGSSVVSGIKAAPGAAKNLAVNTARYVYNKPSEAAGNALEFAAGMSPNPVAMFLWGPGGILSPSSAKAPELDPEIAMRHAQAQEARLMQDENYAGGYAEGGEVREGYSNGRVVKPLLATTESLLTKLAKEALERRGAQTAQRVERAADEIPNLEYQYTPDALRNALLADDSLVMTMSPKDFQKFSLQLPSAENMFYVHPTDIAGPNFAMHKVDRDGYLKYLSQFPVRGGGGFNDVPYLKYADTGEYPAIRGHEGRHRMLTLEGMDEPSTLVSLHPTPYLKDDLKDQLQGLFPYKNPYEDERLITRFKSHVYENPKVIPEGRTLDDFNLIDLPEPYAAGGEIREAHSNGKRVVGPLAAAAESAMTRAAEKILAEKAAKEAEKIRLFHGSTEPDLKNLSTRNAVETRGTTWHSSNPEVAETFTVPRAYGEPVWYDDFGNDIIPGRVYQTEITPRSIYSVSENEAQKFIDDSAFQQKIIDMARQQGHDAVLAKNVLEGIGERYPSDVYAVMDDSIQNILKKDGGTVVKRAIMLASKMA